ncbi:hypothetical protein [Microbulbifer epialgicus]|uniref:Uncharacterized protein n=1 Tax=Microbulbifer epialgicus TaxID=393907 RepID=A0ABV4NVK5_9GAMM
MANTEFAVKRVFNYMSYLWQEHETLSEERRKLESSAEHLKIQLRKLERNLVKIIFKKSVRSMISCLRERLAIIKRSLSNIVQRSLEITKATNSWAHILAP